MFTKLLLGLLIVSNSVPLTMDHNRKEYRQYNKVNEVSADSANIETTNVDYDLRYIFGGEEGYQDFDISTLLPDETDRYTNSKFLCAKPVGDNLYLYFYQKMNTGDYDLIDSTFTISFSNEKDPDSGLYVENYKTYNARFINRYGYRDSFFKVAIDDVVDLSQDFRCNILNYQSTFNLEYVSYNYETPVYWVNHEFTFTANDNQDYMLDYFGSDYVTITDGAVNLLLTRANIQYQPSFDFAPSGLKYSDWLEDFYYFFSTDRDLGDLEEIQYDYTLTSYTEVHDNGRKQWSDIGYDYTTFIGILNDIGGYDENGNVLTDKITWLEEDSEWDQLLMNYKIVKGGITNQVSRPYFWFWNHDNNYCLENIQNCLDTTNLVGDENKGFLGFVNSVQNERVNKNKDKFQWAFRVGSFVRSCEAKLISDDWSWAAGETIRSFTYCHEVKNAMIVRLRFKVGMNEYEMNVLDIPKDTTGVFIQDVPYRTLADDVVDFVVNFFNNASDGLDKLMQIILIVLLAIVFLMLLKMLLSILNFAGSVLPSKKRKRKGVEKK